MTVSESPTTSTDPTQAGATPPRCRRERFLRACACQPVDVPPVWLMRQAGRALPEYRALKAKHSFLELVQTPELAAEVTLQPIRRFDFDAAILFSDILVVPEALGQGYSFREAGGIQMDFAIGGAADVAKLRVEALEERLQYVAQALRLTRSALDDKTALLGFAGSPWTLANFMLEGGSATQPTRALECFQRDGRLFGSLMEKLTQAVIGYLRMQIQAGVDGVQVFDTLGGLLPAESFEAASGRWMKDMVSALGGTVPVVVFAKGVHRNWDTLVATGAGVVGVDWGVRLSEVCRQVPDSVALQGNLEPALLARATPAEVASRTQKMLEEMRGRPGYICNLGHGLPPDAKLENIESMVLTVRGFA
jgi:uroporphyrinogen decarboxylase